MNLIHGALPNYTDQEIRLSLDNRFQEIGHPVAEHLLEPHLFDQSKIGWEEIYKDWEDSNGTKLPPRPQPTVRNSNIPPTQLNEIANAQEAADQMNRLNADGKYTAFVRDPANAGKMASAASLLAKLVYRTNQPTPEMITHATNWLKTLQEE